MSGVFSDSVASFLSNIGAGIETIMTCTYLADEIGAGDDPEYAYVRDTMLVKEPSAIGEERHWFSTSKFNEMLQKVDERPFITKALLLLEEHDLTVHEALYESCTVESDHEPIAVPVYREVRANPQMTFADLFKFQ